MKDVQEVRSAAWRNKLFGMQRSFHSLVLAPAGTVYGIDALAQRSHLLPVL
jgi:hypothetical protein